MSESGLFAASTQTVVAQGDSRCSPAFAAVKPTKLWVNGSMLRPGHRMERETSKARVPPAEAAVIACDDPDRSSGALALRRETRRTRELAFRPYLSPPARRRRC